MPDCDSVPVPTVRVYLKRLPSGAYRVTVLSPSLSGPLFRMYPAGTGEAEAVARAVGRALEKLPDYDGKDAAEESEPESSVSSAFDVTASAGLALFGDGEHPEKEDAKRAPYAGHANQTEGGDSSAHLALPSCSDKETAPQDKESINRARIGCEGCRSKPDKHASTNKLDSLPTDCIKHSTQHRRPPRRVCVVWQGLLWAG